MNTAYLLTGANIGDREANLEKAADLIRQSCGEIIARSSIYETAAWGNQDQDAFLNQVLQIQTPYSARQLMRKILKVEKQMGRERTVKYGPRSIDIDILFYNSEVHDYPLLRLPHPELPRRRFALVPLAELAPGFQHPVLKKSIAALLEACDDPLPVTRLR